MKKKLLTSTILRKQGTGSRFQWKKGAEFVNLASGYCRSDRKELRFDFDLSAPGVNGTTNVRVIIGPGDYPAILKAMCEADRNWALAAMSTELARQLKG